MDILVIFIYITINFSTVICLYTWTNPLKSPSFRAYIIEQIIVIYVD